MHNMFCFHIKMSKNNLIYNLYFIEPRTYIILNGSNNIQTLLVACQWQQGKHQVIRQRVRSANLSKCNMNKTFITLSNFRTLFLLQSCYIDLNWQRWFNNKDKNFHDPILLHDIIILHLLFSLF